MCPFAGASISVMFVGVIMAVLSSLRPDLLEYSDLKPDEHKDNLNNAFDIAYTSLGLPKLLDAAGE